MPFTHIYGIIVEKWRYVIDTQPQDQCGEIKICNWHTTKESMCRDQDMYLAQLRDPCGEITIWHWHTTNELVWGE